MPRRLHALLVLALLSAMISNALLPVASIAAASPTPPLAPDQPANQAPTATSWCVAGAFQGWNNASTPLNDDGTDGDLFAGDGIFSRDVTIGAPGRYEWKAVECGNWANSYPTNNSWLLTDQANQVVKITFDTSNHGTDAGLDLFPVTNIVNAWDSAPATFTAVGSFQNLPWTNNDPLTALVPLGNGIYRLAYTVPNAGTYEAKLVRTGSWTEQWGTEGRTINGANYNFTTVNPNTTVIFLVDTRTGRTTITLNGSGSGNWCAAGAFQNWNNASTPLNDAGTDGDLVGGDGVFSRDVTVATTGRYEWKIVACGDWNTSFPAQNSWLTTGADNQVVKLTFDTNNHANDAGLPLLPAQNILNAWDTLPTSVTAVGDFQGWNNSNAATAMTSQGRGWHSLNYTIPTVGSYNGKIVKTGVWDGFGNTGRSIDPANIAFQTLSANAVVRFALDAYTGRLAIIAPPANGAGHDNNIFFDDLGHNSRDGRYRTPGGPVTAGTAVTMRLSAASGDLTGAQLRIWNDRTNVQSLLPMQRVLDDGTLEWWEATVPASALPTIFYYRFIVQDGTATAYYEDDLGRTGGWGEALATSRDTSWQLTVYSPTMQTPDWVKNAVIYQIFPDRFRDGDASNNTAPSTFFYNEPGGTVSRSLGTDWNQVVCDPRATTGPCAGKYSSNFYGGDLQGILDKLDYLEDLGVTAIYLNPIFESPSNHKYDTTDFSKVDDNFGTLSLFQTLSTQAKARGIRIILDGVFNHTSSDSIYFDRYGRYPELGGCESASSPYRSWFHFSPATPAGSGPCDGENYESWFGYDSLPKLVSGNPLVRDLIISGGANAIAPYWMQYADGWRLDVGGDVDPGLTNDPNNTFWEAFRTAVHNANPEAYIVGEEWGMATAWTLGDEWDATMNYQTSSAILSFWRDETFVDNDHNTGSSAGTLTPISPTQLDERLHNLMERYPPEALYAMMNLLGSHDTSRPLFMLDHNVDQNNPALYNDPNYDWSDAMRRLKGVVLLQMTLPGAPTIYYGDEVGLVGPPAHDGSTWQDDPYNRQPFPWLDQTGTPFYSHLRTEAGQDQLRTFYATLANARKDHAALREGSFDTLLTDDTAKIYAYGRKLADHSDAALVITNRSNQVQNVTLDLSGYLPVGAPFKDLFTNATVSVAADGTLSATVPPQGGTVLLLNGTMSTPPAAVTGLAVTSESAGTVGLTWAAASGANSYAIYRSTIGGGGYTLAGTTAGTTYTDSGLTNSQTYYYVVVSRNTVSGLESGYSNEVSATPHHDLGAAGVYYNLQHPMVISHTISTSQRTPLIYGQLYLPGATNGNAKADGIWAQVGYGPAGSTPSSSWQWTDMVFNTHAGDNDEYKGDFLPDTLGEYDFTTRWSSDGGATWYYADRDGPDYTVGRGGRLVVLPSNDTTAPEALTDLALVSTSPSAIRLSWGASTSPDLAGYELYRELVTGDTVRTAFSRIAVLDAATTQYTDQSVTTGQRYRYYVVPFDTSFNRAGPSNLIEGSAVARMVAVTFNVTVPAGTPGSVFLVGGHSALGNWAPSVVTMTQVNATTWTRTLHILDETTAPYKYTRGGGWETVEKMADGNAETANRDLVVAHGATGLQTINDTVANWRDPFVVGTTPGPVANVPVSSTISLTWNQAMAANSGFSVVGPNGAISGTLTASPDATTLSLQPGVALTPGTTYSVTASGLTDAGGDVQQVPTSYQFQTCSPYDVAPTTCNGLIDVHDIVAVANRWERRQGDGDYTALLDIDRDGDIDIADISQVAGRWNTTP